MSYYNHHVFFCVNQRAEGERQCCHNHGGSAMLDYAKQKVKALGLLDSGRVRVQKAGCFDRCEQGPLLVVYPVAVWYTFVDEEDIDEILTEHLQHGRIVDRLRVADHA